MRIFKKRHEESELSDVLKDLRKIIGRRDAIRHQEAKSDIYKIAQAEETIALKAIRRLTAHKNGFMDDISGLIAELDTTAFTHDEIQEVIDYCFRFGAADAQKNGVVILGRYAANDKGLKDRYRFTFLKDRRAQEYLRKIYSAD